MAKSFLDECTSCKIGTIPMVVRVHGRDKMEVGKWVRVKYAEGGRWEEVLITEVRPDGYFMANR
jgi:hypothetical protein